MTDFAWLSRWQSHVLGILRIVTALLYLQHPLVKLFGFPPDVPPGQQPVGNLFWIAGVVEIIFTPLILLGLFTRPAAFIASGEMAVGYFIGHFPKSPWPVANMGEGAILFCFIFLYLAAAGPGAWSVDAARMKSRFGNVERR